MNKKQIHQDIYIGFVCLAISLAIFVLNTGIPSDAALMPRITASLLTILSILIIYQGIRKSHLPEAEEKKMLSWDGIKVPVVTWGLVALYVVLFNLIGYFAATGIMIIVLMKFMKQTSWKMIIAIDAGYLLVIYFVFVRMLGVSIDGFGMLGRLL